MTPQLLAQEFADAEQAALAEADRKFQDIHGPDDQWSDQEDAAYRRLLDRVHAVFHMPAGA